MATQSYFQVRLLGPAEITHNGTPIGRVESRKALGLLCYLCSQTKAVDRAQLVALFWGDKEESRGRGNLSRALHSISQQLPACLESDRYSVRFRHHERFWVDVLQFEALVAQRKPHLLAAATELYRGEFLENLSVKACPDFELWLTGEREQWRQRAAQAFQTVILHHTERGEYEHGLRYATRLLALDPWREEVHRQKMLLHHLSGQRAAALAQFEQCRLHLAEELGVDPGPETLLLRQQIEEVHTPLATSIRSLPQRDPLLERGSERTWLFHRYEDACRGTGKVTLVEGGAGVGKTALVDDVLAYAAVNGARVLRSRCYEYRSGLTYEAFVDALRPLFQGKASILSHITLATPWRVEMARFWPEIVPVPIPDPTVQDGEGTARHRLFEAIAQVLLQVVEKERAVILYLDDLHDADQPSLDLLRYLYHRLHTQAIWFVCAYRREETTPNHPLTLFRNVLSREGHLATTVLNPLSSETVFQLLRGYEGILPGQMRKLGYFLQDQSEGNPFVLDQLRQWLQEEGVLTELESRWQVDDVRLDDLLRDGSTIPAAVVAMIENRLARLSPRACRLLQIAATIGRQFDLALLINTAGEPEEWVEICLTSWMARGLVDEIAPRYQFSHVMIWRVVLDELSPLQRLRLEDRIAEARQRGSAAVSRRAPMMHVQEGEG